ncbi:MAG: HD domain-containing protein [Chloroflexota bacterium]|nr:HD domain-containing protein [Chloroflexota bacterium]
MPEGQQCDRILEAAIFAAKKHQGQVRKDHHGSPYVTHPMTVAKVLVEIGGIHDTQTLVAAILHDTIEDTPTTKDDLREKFGKDVLGIVMEVTDDKRLPKLERKRQQVVHAPTLSLPARLIKLGDKLVNCREILKSPPMDWDLTRRRNYIQWGADVLAQIRGTNAALENAFDAMLANAEAELDFKIQTFYTIQERPWAP